MITDIITALLVLLAHLFALVLLVMRYHQTRHVGLIGVITGMLLITVSYTLFTYNAVMGYSNAPLRYFLRLGNGIEAFSLGIYALNNWIATRHISRRMTKGGRNA